MNINPLFPMSESPPADPEHALPFSDSSEDEAATPPRPENPYKVGCTFLVRRHRAPPPLGLFYPAHWTYNYEAPSPQTDYCLSRAPRGGSVYWHETLLLTITSVIQTGDNCDAQVVTVHGFDGKMVWVAKLFDPLYYNNIHGDGAFLPYRDVVYEADKAYSTEVAAYEELQNSPEALAYVPKYYGSWTTEIKTPVGKVTRRTMRKRQVRLILMEALTGVTMSEIDPHRLPKKVRYTMLIKAIEAENVICGAGVQTLSFGPRNVIFTRADYAKLNFAVKIVHFDTVLVHHLVSHVKTIAAITSDRILRATHRNKMVQPIKRYSKGGLLRDFCHEGWLHHSRLCGDVEARDWLWKYFHANPKYIPMPREEMYRFPYERDAEDRATRPNSNPDGDIRGEHIELDVAHTPMERSNDAADEVHRSEGEDGLVGETRGEGGAMDVIEWVKRVEPVQAINLTMASHGEHHDDNALESNQPIVKTEPQEGDGAPTEN